MQGMVADRDGRSSCTYTVSWRDGDGENFTATVLGVRLSESQLGISLRQEIKAGSVVHVETPDGSLEHDSIVRQCRRGGASYVIDLQFQEPEAAEPPAESVEPE